MDSRRRQTVGHLLLDAKDTLGLPTDVVRYWLMPALRPLPEKRDEFAEWRRARVNGSGRARPPGA